ncbi:hypothetical protein SAMN05877842_10718 [Ureibacillus acetophenoni]|uniref:Uncharacterized protein n=1 Tax=Ureibacillus acetophenoni TaxID=614649 RepID=A0A285UDT3_9BACL|nr:hypothetical protein SAMN05877842_10718 [Ureibacillus acetophenoni]
MVMEKVMPMVTAMAMEKIKNKKLHKKVEELCLARGHSSSFLIFACISLQGRLAFHF